MGQIDSVVTKIEEKALVSLFFTNENYISEIHNLYQGGANGGGAASMLTLLDIDMPLFTVFR